MGRWSWSYWILSSQKAFNRSTRGWWAGVAQASVAAVLILAGVIWLVSAITVVALYSTPESSYLSLPFFTLHLLLALALIGIGGYLAFISLWQMGATEERRRVLVDQATDMDWLGESHSATPLLPTVPRPIHPPVRGEHLTFRLRGSRRNLWALLTSALVFVLFVALAAVLVITAWYKYNIGRADYFAGALAIPFALAALWAFGYFVRQLLKLSSFGPSRIELSHFPLTPGQPTEMLLTQAGRLRIQLLDVRLECEEVASFHQGTNVRTERRTIYSDRLFRRRGIPLPAGEVLTERLKFSLPENAMHSFVSPSNRVQWKIEIHGQVKGFPRIVRTYEVIVVPNRPGRDSDPAQRERSRETMTSTS